MIRLYARLRVYQIVPPLFRPVLDDPRRERSHVDLYLAGSLRGQQLHLQNSTFSRSSIMQSMKGQSCSRWSNSNGPRTFRRQCAWVKWRSFCWFVRDGFFNDVSCRLLGDNWKPGGNVRCRRLCQFGVSLMRSLLSCSAFGIVYFLM